MDCPNFLCINTLVAACLAAIVLSSCAQPEPPAAQAEQQATATPFSMQVAWEVSDGIRRPESAAYDPVSGALYVSNMGGDARAKDANSYIARIAIDGSSVDSTWVTGLNAPKGVDIGTGKLFVADIDHLVEIDIASAQITARYPAEGATFLNDVTVAPDGSVYVSDMEQASIWRLADGQFTKWLEGDAIRSPNGLYAEAERLLIVANGTAIENPGSNRYMMAISYADKSVTPLRDEVGIGSLDAIEPDGQGGYILSDWAAGKVLYYTPAAGASEILTVSQGTADLEYVASQRMVYLPVMMSDKVIAYQVP